MNKEYRPPYVIYIDLYFQELVITSTSTTMLTNFPRGPCSSLVPTLTNIPCGCNLSSLRTATLYVHYSLYQIFKMCRGWLNVQIYKSVINGNVWRFDLTEQCVKRIETLIPLSLSTLSILWEYIAKSDSLVALRRKWFNFQLQTKRQIAWLH